MAHFTGTQIEVSVNGHPHLAPFRKPENDSIALKIPRNVVVAAMVSFRGAKWISCPSTARWTNPEQNKQETLPSHPIQSQQNWPIHPCSVVSSREITLITTRKSENNDLFFFLTGPIKWLLSFVGVPLKHQNGAPTPKNTGHRRFRLGPHSGGFLLPPFNRPGSLLVLVTKQPGLRDGRCL